jgi:hypothetical protein
MFFNYLNIVELVSLTLLASVTVRLTFLAYYTGVAGNVIMLKALCRLIGASVITLNIGSFLVGFDVSARCYVKVECLQKEVQELAEVKPSVQVVDQSDLSLWSVVTPAGTHITWRNEDGLRTGTSELTKRNLGSRHGSVSSGRSNGNSSLQYDGFNVSPNDLHRM